MEKALFEITNTRYIWTIAHYLTDDETTDELDDTSIAQLRELAFSHGIRDAETYRTALTIRNHSKAQIKEKFSFHKIEQIKRLNDTNKDNKKISDEIIDFLENERKFFKFAADGIVDINNFDEKQWGIADIELINLNIVESVFLPVLSAGENRKIENKLIHGVGFEYTKNYLKGFFNGIYCRLDRDQITGVYHHGDSIECFFKGYKNNIFIFSIKIQDRALADAQHIAFDNTPLLGNYKKKIMNIHNTRYMWTIRLLTFFIGNTDKIHSIFKTRLEKISFSHGSRDYETYQKEYLPETKVPDTVNSIIEFLKTKKIFKCAIQEINNTFTIIIPDDPVIPVHDDENDLPFINIFLPHQFALKDSNPKAVENKQIHRVGFVYTKNYILGLFYSRIKKYKRNAVTGFYDNDNSLACYYSGYINNSFTFVVCPMANSKEDAEFDNSMLLIHKP